jgi:hypothetical protein
MVKNAEVHTKGATPVPTRLTMNRLGPTLRRVDAHKLPDDFANEPSKAFRRRFIVTQLRDCIRQL